MKGIQKLLSLCLILLMSVSNMSGVFAQLWWKEVLRDEQQSVMLDMENAQKKLQTIQNGEKYIQTIDKVIEKLSKNKRKLENLQSRLDKASEKLEGKMDLRSIKLKVIVRYLELKVQWALIDIALQNMDENSLSHEEKAWLDEKIITFQKQLLQQTQSKMEVFFHEFDMLTKYQETGTMNASLLVDIPDTPKVDGYLQFHDYEAITNNFDSRFEGDFRFGVEIDEDQKESVKLDVKWILDFISKQWDIFAKIEQYEIINEQNIEEFQDFLKVLETIALENGYIHYSDEESQKAMQILKSFSPAKIFSDAHKLMEKPLFTAYKKQGERYYIIPTKQACDVMKKAMNTFDPFHGDNCTQGQYESFIKRDLKDIDIFLEFHGDITTLGFESQVQDMEEMKGYILFTDTQLLGATVSVIPDQEEYPEEGIEFFYKKAERLDLSVMITQDFQVSWESLLDSNNRLSYIKAYGYAQWYRESLNWNVNLENNSIDGSLTYDQGERSSYDYQTGEYTKVQWPVFRAEIKGQTHSDNTISELQVVYGQQDPARGNVMQWDMIFSGKNFSWNHDYSSQGTLLNVDFDLEMNSSGDQIRGFDFTIDTKTKQREWNATDYSYNYIGEYQDVFVWELSLENSNITGKAIVSREGNAEAKVHITGKYAQDIFELKNYIDLGNRSLESLNPYNFSQEEWAEAKMDVNVNMNFDTRQNKNDMNFYIDSHFGGRKIFEFELDNTGRKVFRNIEIPTPTNTKSFEEVFIK